MPEDKEEHASEKMSDGRQRMVVKRKLTGKIEKAKAKANMCEKREIKCS